MPVKGLTHILASKVYCAASAGATRDVRDPDRVVRVPNAFPTGVDQGECNLVQRLP